MQRIQSLLKDTRIDDQRETLSVCLGKKRNATETEKEKTVKRKEKRPNLSIGIHFGDNEFEDSECLFFGYTTAHIVSSPLHPL